MAEVFVPLIVFSFAAAVVKMVLDYKRDRLQVGAGSSMTTAELQEVVRVAVEEAVAPLVARVERLEESQRPASPEHAPKHLPPVEEVLREQERPAALSPHHEHLA